VRLEHADHRETDWPATDHDCDVTLAHLAAPDGVPPDGHRLGQRGYLGGQPVRDGQRQRLLDEELLGVGARRHRRQPDSMHLFAAPQQRHGDDRCAGPRGLAGAGTVIDDLAAELVSEHDVLIRSHEGVVARFGHHVGEFVAVVARMQVRSADATLEHVEQQLPLGRCRSRLVDDLELRVGTGHGLHLAVPLIGLLPVFPIRLVAPASPALIGRRAANDPWSAGVTLARDPRRTGARQCCGC
jgi:hypothetical protein